MRKRSKKPVHQLKIAKERIVLLFEEADKTVDSNALLARRYAMLARKIGMRYNVRLTREQKRHICKNCRAYLKPGCTSLHRVRNGRIRITCLLCKKTTSLLYK
jgi:ribonuclease P protein subunit RPR2